MNRFKDAPNLNHLWAALIVEELVRNDVIAFFVSPGSRSTPLALAVAQHPKAAACVHYDERGAAFAAVGYAKACGEPAALICTSGTATANYYPAIIEAAQSYTPLIVLTADRPPELQGVGANQTINQTRLYGEYVREFFALPCPDRAVPPEHVLTTIDEAVHCATDTPEGPVHINCPYREPLAPTQTNEYPERHLSSLGSWLRGAAPVLQAVQRADTVKSDARSHLACAEAMDKAERGLVILGTDTPFDRVHRFVRTLQWPVLPDVTSGCRFRPREAPYVHFYDQILLSADCRDRLRPDFVLQLGGPVVSKRLLQFLEDCAPSCYVRVSAHDRRHDPIHRVTHQIVANVAPFTASLRTELGGTPNVGWFNAWGQANVTVSETIEAFLKDNADLSEIAVARHVSRHAPADGALFLGNSMPIRDMDMYGAAGAGEQLVVANRGASGIDGNIATAAGAALACGAKCTAVIGDLAALHDLNSLALLKEARVVLVVINNDGGGIFSFLPIADHEADFERFFGTPHGMDFENAAAQFGLPYTRPESMAEFAQAYERAVASKGSYLIEVQTDRNENFRLHQKLQQTIVEALEA